MVILEALPRGPTSPEKAVTLDNDTLGTMCSENHGIYSDACNKKPPGIFLRQGFLARQAEASQHPGD